MTTLNIEYVQDHFTEFLDKVTRGESFQIAKDGMPIVQVTPVPSSSLPARRIGMLDGKYIIPDDIKAIDREEIIDLFEGNLR